MDVGVRLPLNESADDVARCDDLSLLDVDIGQLEIAVGFVRRHGLEGVDQAVPVVARAGHLTST